MVVSPEGLLSPRIGRVALSTLQGGTNQADYLVIGPREFLEAAAPLLERRRSQGLVVAGGVVRGDRVGVRARAALGGGDQGVPRRTPTTRGSVPRRGTCCFSGTRRTTRSGSWRRRGRRRLPALWAKTSYLWTASDPALGGGERGGPAAGPGDRAASGDDAGAGGDAGREASGVGGLGAGALGEGGSRGGQPRPGGGLRGGRGGHPGELPLGEEHDDAEGERARERRRVRRFSRPSTTGRA